ncbi:DoxX family protein [Notoacmeibacter sp. MSK16QG-6]|uniref:DoxX family protein n=1 Tax=Notoacmeibacter sp. MSK16QG-6 TaxID=2957982 RepID=UPI00209E5ED7|nr:DoxX family protein [Notoacmeibacter sp. MSK16QG-6]MCP1198086.1 DoxX family protein [Notoacmeibacter sp. MSK16QG-6]
MITVSERLTAATRMLEPFALLALRFALAVPFFKSGLTKWDGFGRLSDTTTLLFTHEFRLHIFGASLPYPFPTLMAWMSGVFEILLPVLLVLGLMTRFSALGLLVMTAIIQLTVPSAWANFHLPWAAMALALVVYGAGPIGIDRIFGRWLGNRSTGEAHSFAR